MITHVWLALVFFWLFVLGSAVGSFLNVVIYRLPRRKNLFWPSSRCGVCFTAIAASDNIPLLSYWRLGGRCRACGGTFSPRYFGIELLTGLAFALLYLLEVGLNLHGFTAWSGGGLWYLEAGLFAPGSWALFTAHALLVSLLIAATGCLLDTGRIPPALALTGASAGLCWGLLYPWPAPTLLHHGLASAERLPLGFVPWPVWSPLPSWLPPGSLHLGLATSLSALLLGPSLVRLVHALYRRMGGLPRSAPAVPLLLLSGGFLGWQPQAFALAMAVPLTLPLTRLVGDPHRGLGLAVIAGLVVSWLGWRWIGPLVQPLLLAPLSGGGSLIALGTMLLALEWLLSLSPTTGGRRADG